MCEGVPDGISGKISIELCERVYRRQAFESGSHRYSMF